MPQGNRGVSVVVTLGPSTRAIGCIVKKITWLHVSGVVILTLSQSQDMGLFPFSLQLRSDLDGKMLEPIKTAILLQRNPRTEGFVLFSMGLPSGKRFGCNL